MRSSAGGQVPTGTRRRLARAFARNEPGGLLYGAVVSAGSLAAVSANATHAHHVAIGVAAVLVAYWLAHVYVRTQKMLFLGAHQPLPRRLAAAGGGELAVLWGGAPALLIFVGGHWLLGLDVHQAALVALWFSVAFLFGIGYLGAHHVGLSGRALWLEAAGAGSLGIIAVVAKLLLH